MPEIAKWFDRKFDFSFPVEHYPNLLARLRGTPSRLDDLLQHQRREVLVKQPGGKWSPQEHLGHLLDLESLWLARTQSYRQPGGELPPADLNNRQTHKANHNARAAAELLHAFRSARMGLLNEVEAFEPALFSRAKLHPRLKQPMRLVDHLYFVAEHDDHHLAHIWELVTRVGATR
jgi:uncharacterized damage-inducible protein DinB